MDRPEAHGALVSPRPRFPGRVQRALIDRRLRLLATIGEDVLDLSRPAARVEVLAAAGRELDPMSERECGRRYANVVSVAELVRFPDLVLALRGIERLLTDDGTFWVIEPVHHASGASTLFASLWAAHPSVAGAHVERDVPLAMRAVGLAFTDLERFVMPTSVYPLRMFVQGRARRVVHEVAA